MSDNYLRHCYVSIVSIVPQDKLYFQYLEQGRNYQKCGCFLKMSSKAPFINMAVMCWHDSLTIKTWNF